MLQKIDFSINRSQIAIPTLYIKLVYSYALARCAAINRDKRLQLVKVKQKGFIVGSSKAEYFLRCKYEQISNWTQTKTKRGTLTDLQDYKLGFYKHQNS